VLFENGKNIRQVSQWLRHADPDITLRTYIHARRRLGDADFLGAAVTATQAEMGNGWATRSPEMSATPAAVSTG
jgi:hypothetical protein